MFCSRSRNIYDTSVALLNMTQESWRSFNKRPAWLCLTGPQA